MRLLVEGSVEDGVMLPLPASVAVAVAECQSLT